MMDNYENTEDIEDLLFTAFIFGHMKIVKFLISYGANIHIHIYNEQLLKWSCSGGRLDMIKFLISYGANIHIDNDIILKIARERGHQDIIEFLESQDNNITTIQDVD